MIQINVSQQLKSPIGTTRDYEIDGTVDMDGREARVQGQVTLMRTDRSILVTGKLNSETRLDCSRCLSPFVYRCRLNLEEEYFPVNDIHNGASLPAPDEPGTFTIDEHNIIDLSEATRQYTVLAIPMKPLCRPDCAGLCPSCGTNLNQSTCDCPTQPADPRWARLSELVLSKSENRSSGEKGTD